MMNGSAARLDRLRPNLVIESRRRVREAVGRGVDVINLGVGDPDQPTPEHIVDALVRAAGDPANHRYPAGEMRGTPLFRKAVSSWYARRFGVNVDPDTEVMALIGSKEGSHHLALGLLDPGDTAIVPDPAYPVYEASALLAGANVVHLPLDRSRGYLPDLDATSRRQAEAAKVMWLSYPNNPYSTITLVRLSLSAPDDELAEAMRRIAEGADVLPRASGNRCGRVRDVRPRVRIALRAGGLACAPVCRICVSRTTCLRSIL